MESMQKCVIASLILEGCNVASRECANKQSALMLWDPKEEKKLDNKYDLFFLWFLSCAPPFLCCTRCYEMNVCVLI